MSNIFVLKRLNKIAGSVVLDKAGHAYTCGRGTENEIICPHKTISRKHCIFFCDKEDVHVMDLQSSNGLFINGTVQEPHNIVKLCHDDIIGIGCPDMELGTLGTDTFVYKVHISKPSPLKNKQNTNDLSRTILNNSVPSEDGTAEKVSEILPKRKREKPITETPVPVKIQRLEKENPQERNGLLAGTSMTEDENDIEVVHVSLKNTSQQQNISNFSKNEATIKVKNNSKSNLSVNEDNSLERRPITKNGIVESSSEFKSPIVKSKNTKPLVIKNSDSSYNSTWPINLNNETTLHCNSNQTSKEQNESENTKSPSEEKKKQTSTPINNKYSITNKINSKRKINNTTKPNKSITNFNDQDAAEDRLEPCSDISKTEKVTIPPASMNPYVHIRPLPSNFICNGDSVIKLEEELQITDDDEEALLKLCSTSPLKLRKVQQTPKTRFSEVDIVNLSDEEDNIFPCSQLFDTGFGMNTLIKQEIKKEPVDNDDNNDDGNVFNTYDYRDRVMDNVIALSDSEEEDNLWLQKLSQSQIFNDSEYEETKIKEQIVVEEKPADFEEAVNKSDSHKSHDLPASNDKEQRFEAENTTSKRSYLFMDVDETPSVTSSDSEEIFSRKKHDLNGFSRRDSSTQQHLRESVASVANTSLVEPSTSSKVRNVEKKIPEIEAPYMTTGRRRCGIIYKSKSPEKIMKEKQEKKKPYQTKAKADRDVKEMMYGQKQKKWAIVFRSDKNKAGTLTKEEKKNLVADRKAKLKEIALEKKRLAEANNKEKKRTITKPKAKVSVKTRGDFLVNEQLNLPATKSDNNASTLLNTSASSARTSVESKDQKNKSTQNLQQSVIPDETGKIKIPEKNDTPKRKTGSSEKTLKRSSKNKKTIVDRLEETHLSEKQNNASKRRSLSILDETPKSLPNKNQINPDSPDIIKIPERLGDPNQTTDSLVEELQRKVLSTKPVAKKSNLRDKSKISSAKSKKRVTFSINIQSVHEYTIEPQNVLRKFTGKDAPIPAEKLPPNGKRNVQGVLPKLEEFLLKIFMWNPVWLEEQQYLKFSAPVVREEDLHPMLTRYKSFDEYYRIVSNLLLLEIWCSITKEFEDVENSCRRPTMMCSIVENSIVPTIVSPTCALSTLMLEVLITKQDLQKQAYPNYGDLVFFEYVNNQGKYQTFHKVFAYVNYVHQTVLTPLTYYNKDLKNYVQNPHALLTFTMMTKSLEKCIPVNRVQRMRGVTYLRHTLRMVQALQYLPNSPVMNLILNPQIDLYQLPPISKPQPYSLASNDKLNAKQLDAVLKVTESVVQKKAKLCFIHGPPGTGKSKVIVNTVIEILYGDNRYRNNGGSFRILVCAPSNAAIDEVVLKLLDVRRKIPQNRFKMVRIGRSESMHPSVRDISVTELAKRDVKKTTTSYSSKDIPNDCVEEEKTFLEARINALKCKLVNSLNIDETEARHARRKIADMSAKYDLLRNRRIIDRMDRKDLAKLHRAAENRILEGADIITCTLSSCYTGQMESIFGGNRERISVCIVDEATQSCEAETLIPLMLGVNTLVLVGDTMQLPATVLNQTAKKLGLDQSIFSRVQNAFDGCPNNPIIMLDVQYRMQYEISYWPNKYFYAGKLKNGPENRIKFPFQPYRVLNLNANQNNDKFSNTSEAEFVANMILCMLTYSNFQNFECIKLGVLTPYNSQRSVILKKVEEKKSSVPENIRKKLNIEVNTVDSFQGQERDIIIMSCVRSHGIGFLSDRQRLCVALTRAKHSLILCGNFNSLMRDQMWNALLLDARSRGIYTHISANAKPHEIKSHIIKGDGKDEIK